MSCSSVTPIAILTSASEVVVAKGAVLKSLRGEIITRRFRRRNFGVVEDIPLECFPIHLRGNLEAVRDIEDNELRVRNRMTVIFRNVSTGLSILQNFPRPVVDVLIECSVRNTTKSLFAFIRVGVQCL